MSEGRDGAPPKINSPLRGVTYSLRHGEGSVAFEAVTDGDSHELFWFVGDELVGKSQRGKPLFWAARSGSLVKSWWPLRVNWRRMVWTAQATRKYSWTRRNSGPRQTLSLG